MSSGTWISPCTGSLMNFIVKPFGENYYVRIGACGWRYLDAKRYFGDGWKERFGSKLRAYAQLFDCVEVNSTFYRLPRISTAEKWRREVPEGFAFTVKMWRAITHEKQFRGADEETEAFLAVARALRAPVILIQTPRRFRQTGENERIVLDYLSTLPPSFSYALELRGWEHSPRFSPFIWVVDPFASAPPEQDAYYFRLHGSPPGERMYYYRYTDADLEKLADIVLSLSPDSVWLFFNNIWMYEDALRFKEVVARRK
ncbi:TPA: DUF72 domain-containing protein [Candidatus Micrarchaeota archaeon]|nr:DUF72 domain-containing protein [Candidatus Micrarchaeota archaeon]